MRDSLRKFGKYYEIRKTKKKKIIRLGDGPSHLLPQIKNE